MSDVNVAIDMCAWVKDTVTVKHLLPVEKATQIDQIPFDLVYPCISLKGLVWI